MNEVPHKLGSRPGLWPTPEEGLGRKGSGQKFTCLLVDDLWKRSVPLTEGQLRAVSMCFPNSGLKADIQSFLLEKDHSYRPVPHSDVKFSQFLLGGKGLSGELISEARLLKLLSW